MQRRDFLRTTLMLGTSGLLPGTGFAASCSCGLLNTEPLEPIWEAAVNGRWESVKEWLTLDPSLIHVTGEATIGEDTIYNASLLHLAVTNGADVSLLKYLVSQGADVNAKDTDGCTPVCYAASDSTNVEILKYLVSHGADVNAKDNEGWTPLCYAASFSTDVKFLKCLVSHGANVNAKDNDGWTPVFFAANYSTDVEFLEYLVSQGADVHTRDHQGKTPLDIADTEEKKQILRTGGKPLLYFTSV